MKKLQWGVLSTANIGVKRVIPAIIAGQREFDAGKCQVKNLATGEARDVPLTPTLELTTAIQQILA